MSVILIAGLLCPVISLASDTNQSNPDTILLEAMLNGDRHWVIDTLVNDDRSTNPMAILHGRNHEKSLAKDNIDRFNGIDAESETQAAVYKKMVLIMEKYYNADDYLSGLFGELGEAFSWVVGLFSSQEDAKQTAKRLTTTRDEIGYDNLLKGVFTASYTATDGTKLADEESSLSMLRQVKDGLDYFNAFSKYVNTSISTIIGSGNRTEFDSVYMDDYALAYCDAANGYFSALDKTVSSSNQKNSAEMAAYLSTIAQIMALSPQESYAGFSYTDYLAESLADSDAVKLLKLAGKPLAYADTALDTYLYVDSIQRNRDTIEGPISRMAALESDKSLKESLQNFQSLMDEEYNNSLLSWDSIATYLRNNQTASKFISKKVGSFIKKHTILSENYMIGATIAKAAAVTSISAWMADQVVGLEDTCNKTYELHLCKDLTDLCIKAYKADLSTYQSSPTNKNAGIVLDDLLLLQRLRLYGEKTVYEMMKSQSDSWIGQIYGGGSADAWKLLYQYSVDELMAATVVPPVNGITVNSGEIMTLGYQSGVGYYARKNAGGKQIYYVDMPTRLASGLTVGGMLVFDSSLPNDFSIGFIETIGSGATIGAYPGNISIGELYQSGSSMQLSQLEGSRIDIENARFSKVTCPVGGDIPIYVQNLELYGAYEGNISSLGNIGGNGGSVASLTVCGNNPTISGSITVGDLNYAHSGTLTQTGTVNVTGALQTNGKRIKGGENTVLKSGGYIVGGSYPHTLTLDGASLNGTAFEDAVTVRGTTTLNDVEFQKLLNQTSGTLKLTGYTEVGGDMNIGGNVSHSGVLKVHGDIFGSDTIALDTLELCGKMRQTVNTPLVVQNYHNKNSSVLILNNTVTVNGEVQSQCKTVNGSKLTLTQGASFFGDSFYGDVTVTDLIGGLPKKLVGTVYISGNITQQSDSVTQGAVIRSGTLTIKDSNLMFKSASELQGGTITLESANLAFDSVFSSSSSAAIAVDADSTISFRDASLGGTLTGAGECRISGDFYNNGTVNIRSLRLEPKLTTSVNGNSINTAQLALFGQKPVTLSTKIYVSESWTGNGKVVNPENVLCTGSADSTKDETYDSLYTVEGDLVIDGRTLTANKGLTVKNGSIILRNGGRLTVNGLTTVTGASGKSILIEEGSEMALKKLAILSTLDSIEVNGTLRFGSDAALTSLVLRGGGTVSLAGDLIGSSLTVDKPENFILCGKLPQTVTAGGANFQNLTIANPSKSGVTFSSAVNCYGTYETGGNAVSGTVNMIEQ